MCRECYTNENRITHLLKTLECLKIMHNTSVVSVAVAFAWNMSRREGCNDGIFPLRYWRLPNCI